MKSEEILISETRKWIIEVVAGCNFCPFAMKEIKKDSILYVVAGKNRKEILEKISGIFTLLDSNKDIETVLIILPEGYVSFSIYLDLFEVAEDFLSKENYEGVYQLASFHPAYLFHGSQEDDPANYTNRSPYPMIHILREESLTKVIDNHPDISGIPKRNIAFTKSKGLQYMQSLRNACFNPVNNSEI